MKEVRSVQNNFSKKRTLTRFRRKIDLFLESLISRTKVS